MSDIQIRPEVRRFAEAVEQALREMEREPRHWGLDDPVLLHVSLGDVAQGLEDALFANDWTGVADRSVYVGALAMLLHEGAKGGWQ